MNQLEETGCFSKPFYNVTFKYGPRSQKCNKAWGSGQIVKMKCWNITELVKWREQIIDFTGERSGKDPKMMMR